MQAADVGAYNGVAALIDDELGSVDIRVSLATADPAGERWFGSVSGAFDHLDLDGREVMIELPAGSRGRVKVVIDLTGDEPVVRLIGSGPAPI